MKAYLKAGKVILNVYTTGKKKKKKKKKKNLYPENFYSKVFLKNQYRHAGFLPSLVLTYD